MLASLASVVLLGQNRLSTGNARAEMTATLSTIYVKFSDQGLTAGFRALELLLLLIGRWMSTEKLEGQVLILFSLLRSQCFKSLELDESLGAVSPATIEHAGNDNNTVDLSC